MDGTILGQGRFVSAGAVTTVKVPSNLDWMRVVNYTKTGVVGTPNIIAVESYWQRGMATGTGIIKYHTNGTTAVQSNIFTSGGFTLYDASGNPVGNSVATTQSSNATRPQITTASTAGLAAGMVVRMSATAQTDVNGVDMVIGSIDSGTQFTLLFAGNALATAPGLVGGVGFFRVIQPDLFYPRRRFVTQITSALNAQVSTSIAHGLTPGQAVRFFVPAASGMTQISYDVAGNVSASILTVVDDYNFTINVDTTAYSLFKWPTTVPNQLPSSFPTVVPFGEDTAVSLAALGAQVPSVGGVQINNTNTGILADSTVNTGFIGMTLGFTGVIATGAAAVLNGPAGAANDVIYWLAGKSTFGGL